MAESTGIEWADSTFNPWIGCTQISPACDNCYAAVSTPARTKGIKWGAGKPRVRTSAKNWDMPLAWQRNHAEFFKVHGRKRRVFCSSLADVFDNEVNPEWLFDLMALIKKTPDLDWLLLTKRIGNFRKSLANSYASAHADPLDIADHIQSWIYGEGHIPHNVWLGITVANQDELNRDLPKLLGIPARVRFLSIEPMLGMVSLAPFANKLTGLHWVICGFESGNNARKPPPECVGWAQLLRRQCYLMSIQFFFKQWGEFQPVKVPGMDTYVLNRVGKREAGSLLDGVHYKQFPSVWLREMQ